MRPTRAAGAAGLVIAVGVLAVFALSDRRAPARNPVTLPESREQDLRERLYAALQPVVLANCTLERLGELGDGGYLMCGNLLQADAGYSYGISGYDGWGCGISTRLGIPVHQYDCFDTRRPQCDGGQTTFHAECISPTASVDAEGRVFDALATQVARNGDAARRLVVKMDVEGAEWQSLLDAPPEVLDRIDQLAIEMHGDAVDTWTQYLVVSRLKDRFHVAHLHMNNYGCGGPQPPMPSYAWEALFVNKRLATLAPDQRPVLRPHPLDSPNNPAVPDCQYMPDGVGARPR